MHLVQLSVKFQKSNTNHYGTYSICCGNVCLKVQMPFFFQVSATLPNKCLKGTVVMNGSLAKEKQTTVLILLCCAPRSCAW